MAKPTYEACFMDMCGKLGKRSKIIFAHRSDNGTQYTQLQGERSVPVTEAERSKREKFKQTIAKVKAVMLDSEQLTAATERFKQQKKYPTLRGFIFAEEYAKLTA